MKCRVCDGDCVTVIDFGQMPIANGFLKPEDVATEARFPLEVVSCSRCTMWQLAQAVPASTLFPADYAFHSSTSMSMAAHFEQFAQVALGYVGAVVDPFLVEIGSNDGILLRHVAAAGVRHVGVEPAANVAEVARSRGVQTVSRFFDLALANDILAANGVAHVIVAANVICHIENIHQLAAGVERLLAPDGVFMFEDPYLGDIIELASFDQLYDEHVFYFSLTSVQALFAQHGMEVVNAARQPVHGGSMRYTIARRGRREPTPAVARLRERELANGFAQPDTCVRFREQVEQTRGALRDLLTTLRANGRRVVGYGATSKSTTTLVYCGLTTDHIEFVCDTTPGKQGRLSPGAHIPVRAPEAFSANWPDFALLFAWNHRAEILSKEQAFVNAGGRFIAYVPRVGVISGP